MQITYNNVTLPYSNTSRFQQKSVYDPSGTDRMLTRFEIETQFVVNINYLPLLMPDLALQTAVGGGNKTIGGNAGTIMAVLRERLLTARKTLSVKFAGVEIIPQQQPGRGGTTDAKNGPQPRGCDIVSFTNETFLVTFKIEAHYWENFSIELENSTATPDQGRSGDVISNRWSEEASIDDCGYTRRTRTGVYSIRSDSFRRITPDELRSQFAVLSVPDGFIRESSRYLVAPDGLSLSYTVIDTEVSHFPAPFAHKAEGHYAESCTFLGVKRYAEARVKLYGTKSTPQARLLEQAIIVVISKLRAAGATILGKDPNSIPPAALKKAPPGMFRSAMVEYATLRTNLYQNTAEAYVKMRYSDSQRRIINLNTIGGGTSGTPLSPQGGGTQPTYRDRGTANLLLQAAAYFDPSLLLTELGPGDIKAGLGNGGNPVTTTGDKKVQTPNSNQPGTE